MHVHTHTLFSYNQSILDDNNITLLTLSLVVIGATSTGLQVIRGLQVSRSVVFTCMQFLCMSLVHMYVAYMFFNTLQFVAQAFHCIAKYM